jgi:hypothetical protein
LPALADDRHILHAHGAMVQGGVSAAQPAWTCRDRETGTSCVTALPLRGGGGCRNPHPAAACHHTPKTGRQARLHSPPAPTFGQMDPMMRCSPCCTVRPFQNRASQLTRSEASAAAPLLEAASPPSAPGASVCGYSLMYPTCNHNTIVVLWWQRDSPCGTPATHGSANKVCPEPPPPPPPPAATPTCSRRPAGARCSRRVRCSCPPTPSYTRSTPWGHRRASCSPTSCGRRGVGRWGVGGGGGGGGGGGAAPPVGRHAAAAGLPCAARHVGLPTPAIPGTGPTVTQHPGMAAHATLLLQGMREQQHHPGAACRPSPVTGS